MKQLTARTCGYVPSLAYGGRWSTKGLSGVGFHYELSEYGDLVMEDLRGHWSDGWCGLGEGCFWFDFWHIRRIFLLWRKVFQRFLKVESRSKIIQN